MTDYKYQPPILPDINQLTSLEPEDNSDLGASSLLYGSKVGDYQLCPRLAWFKHHLALYPIDRPRYFIVGSAFHKAVEIGLDMGKEYGRAVTLPDYDQSFLVLIDQILAKGHDLTDLHLADEKELDIIAQMYEKFWEVWEEDPTREVIYLERTVFHELPPNPLFTHWTVKADQVIRDSTGVWNSDLKTTSGYGASTAKQYHESQQTKSYMRVMAEEFPDLRGTKIFVCTKKAIRCVEETIHRTDEDLYQAALHMKSAFEDISQIETTHTFPRHCLACSGQFGKTCDYLPICMHQQSNNPAYFKDVISTWYTQHDPDEHLDLKPKE